MTVNEKQKWVFPIIAPNIRYNYHDWGGGGGAVRYLTTKLGGYNRC